MADAANTKSDSFHFGFRAANNLDASIFALSPKALGKVEVIEKNDKVFKDRDPSTVKADLTAFVRRYQSMDETQQGQFAEGMQAAVVRANQTLKTSANANAAVETAREAVKMRQAELPRLSKEEKGAGTAAIANAEGEVKNAESAARGATAAFLANTAFGPTSLTSAEPSSLFVGSKFMQALIVIDPSLMETMKDKKPEQLADFVRGMAEALNVPRVALEPVAEVAVAAPARENGPKRFDDWAGLTSGSRGSVPQR